MSFQMSNITNFPQQSFDFFNEIGSNPLVIVVFAVIIGIYYLIFVLLGNKNTSTGIGNNGGIVFIEALLWGIFIILILINGVTYFFNIDIKSSIKNIFSSTPEIAVRVNNRGDIGTRPRRVRVNNNTGDENNNVRFLPGNQVFNVPGNHYTYLDAQALCRAFDGELATYQQIFDAYKNGAEWCNYGWSANQMAFFPTQEKTWKKLQRERGHENDCGRIGINGGFIANPNVRFGVNCFGSRPKISSQESKLMQNRQLVPQAIREVEIERRAQQFRNNNLNDILISPFNRDTWSRV